MTEIPDDATGQALRGIVEAGSDLSRPLKMDFFAAVPSEEMGREVERRAAALGFQTSVEQAERGTWTCYCSKTIVPSYAVVVAIENELDAIAREFGGHIDGFGTFGNEVKN
jgi:hypothetical protein